jgi:hydroxyethylthiazole kinase-like uncharacterized protein yjeF
MTGLELLTPQEMGKADRLAVEAGVASLTLMERAGHAVAAQAGRMLPAGGRIAVLCGPGNNGGDGLAAARLLAAEGYAIRLGLLGDRDSLKGDAAIMAGRWTGGIEALAPQATEGADLIIDAILGAGLARPVEGVAAAAIKSMRRPGARVLAVDVPSGVDGATGAVLGVAPEAEVTVTFFRRKPGHLLHPGRGHCGRIVLADIGIPAGVLEEVRPRAFANAPLLWRDAFPSPAPQDHKHRRGHAIAVSGPATRTGAVRLAARAALRAGAGLVTVASPSDALAEHSARLEAVMLARCDGTGDLAGMLADERVTAVLLGPAAGVGERTRVLALTALASRSAVTLDADALTSFAGEPEVLLAATRQSSATPVLTPHEGELRRLLPDLSGNKLTRARATAERASAIVVLKGPDTVIAAPDGRAAINENAPPTLATAGSGDVLAGFVTGLRAQAMPPFEAACAAVWLHGECASRFGPGLIAEDLEAMLPGVLRELLGMDAIWPRAP